MVLWNIFDTRWWWGSYPSVEKQSVYSTAPADWFIVIYEIKNEAVFFSGQFSLVSPFFHFPSLPNKHMAIFSGFFSDFY